LRAIARDAMLCLDNVRLDLDARRDGWTVSRALVAIGVSKAPGLRPLPGAAHDAREMAAWAQAQGYNFNKLAEDDLDARDCRCSHGSIQTVRAELGRPGHF
jgi:hypothetical protein